MFSKLFSVFVPALLLSTVVQGTVVNKATVGPSTSLATKSKICNVLNYGAVADNKTDLGPALSSAFSSCAKAGGATLYIPPGSYSMSTGVILTGGKAFALQIDGLITLTATGSFGGNAIVLKNGQDIEVFSSNGRGAINGQGYITRITNSGQNARLFRFINCSNISIHDIIFVDSPTFHLVFNAVSNLEAYHITVRGPSIGGTDGVDLDCADNCYLHHIQVTNRDECISVKSPSTNVLIEDVYCNQSGGMSIGSLTANGATAAEVSNITMRNIYTYQCTQMLMIKTYPGGTGAFGYVKNSVFENFWAYDTTYALDIDQYWQSKTTPNTGAVALSGLTFSNWTGSVDNGVQRGAIVIRGSDQVPATDITLKGFSMWTVNGNKVQNVCKNVYGTGYCAKSATAKSNLATFTTTVTSTAPPAGYTAPTKPAWGISGYGVTLAIPVYTPAAMWAPVASSVKNNAAAVVQTTTSSPVATVKPSTKKVSVAAVVSTSAHPKATSSSKITSVSSIKSSTLVVVARATSTSTKRKCSKRATTKAATTLKATTTSKAATTSKSSSLVLVPSSTSVVKPVTTSAKSTSTTAKPIIPSSTFLVVKSSSTSKRKCTKKPVATSTSEAVAPTATAVVGTIPKWGECGKGTGNCVAGSTCVFQNQWYSQCL